MSVRVSVVVPTYYRNDRVPAAVESALAQTVETEVVVVDDSGEAHARPAVEPYLDDDRVTYVPLPENRGGNPAREAGIRRAKGEYVQLLDDDDRLHPEKCARCIDGTDDDTRAAYTGMDFEGTDPRLPAPDGRGDVLERALAFDLSPCVTSTLLVERDLLVDLLPLADRPGADDLGLIVRLAARTRFHAVDEVLVTRGKEEGSRGSSWGVVEGRRSILAEFADLYAEHPAARRHAVADTERLAGELHLHDGDRAGALRAFARALRAQPRPSRLVSLLGALAGERGYRMSQHAAVRLP